MNRLFFGVLLMMVMSMCLSLSLSLSGILYSQIGRERRRGFENTQVRI